MRADYYIEYNGKRYTDLGFAKLVFANESQDYTDAHSRIDAQVAWAVNNLKNCNEINMVNGLQSLWYDIIGISNNSIWRYIEDKVAEMVGKGLVKEW